MASEPGLLPPREATTGGALTAGDEKGDEAATVGGDGRGARPRVEPSVAAAGVPSIWALGRFPRIRLWALGIASLNAVPTLFCRKSPLDPAGANLSGLGKSCITV